MVIYRIVLTYAACFSFLALLCKFTQGKSKKEMAFIVAAILVISFFNTEVRGGVSTFELWLTDQLGGTALAAKTVFFMGPAFLGFIFWLKIHRKATKTLTKWLLVCGTITGTLLLWDLLLRPQGKASYEDIVYFVLLPNLACALVASVYYWSKLQNELAVWVGFLILLVLANLTYALIYGISLGDKLGPNPRDWFAGIIMLSVFLTFNTVLYRYSVWYKRWSYKFVKLGLITVFLISGSNFVFQITGDRTSVEAGIRARRNQLALVYSQKKLEQIAQSFLAGSKVPKEDVLNWAKKQSLSSLAEERKKYDQAIKALKVGKSNLPEPVPLSDSNITIKKAKLLYMTAAGQTLEVGNNMIGVGPGQSSNNLKVPAGYSFDIKFPKGYKLGEDYSFIPDGERKFKFEVNSSVKEQLFFMVKVWPQKKPKVLAQKLPVLRFGKGVNPLPLVKAGELSSFWVEAKKGVSVYNFKDTDFKFTLIFSDGTKAAGWKVKNWPRKRVLKFRIKALTEQKGLKLILK